MTNLLLAIASRILGILSKIIRLILNAPVLKKIPQHSTEEAEYSKQSKAPNRIYSDCGPRFILSSLSEIVDGVGFLYLDERANPDHSHHHVDAFLVRAEHFLDHA